MRTYPKPDSWDVLIKYDKGASLNTVHPPLVSSVDLVIIVRERMKIVMATASLRCNDFLARHSSDFCVYYYQLEGML